MSITEYRPQDFPALSAFSEWSLPQDGKTPDYLRKILEGMLIKNEMGGLPGYPMVPTSIEVTSVYAFYHYPVLVIGDLINAIARDCGIERDKDHNSVIAFPNFAHRGRLFDPGFYINDYVDGNSYSDDGGAVESLKERLKGFFGVELYELDRELCPDRNRSDLALILGIDELSDKDEKHNDLSVRVGLVAALSNFLKHQDSDRILQRYIDYVCEGKMRTQDDFNSRRLIMPVQFPSYENSGYEVARDEKSGINIHTITLSDSVRDSLYEAIIKNLGVSRGTKSAREQIYSPNVSLYMGKDNAAAILKPVLEAPELTSLDLRELVKKATIGGGDIIKFRNLPIDSKLYQMEIERRQRELESGADSARPIEAVFASALVSYAGEVITSQLDDDGRKAAHQGFMNRKIGPAQSSVGSGKFSHHTDGCHVAVRHDALMLYFELGNRSYATTLSNGQAAYESLGDDDKRILSKPSFKFYSGTTSTGDRKEFIGMMAGFVDDKFQTRVNFESSRYKILLIGEELERAKAAVGNFEKALDRFSVSVDSLRGEAVLFNNTANPHGREVKSGFKPQAASRFFKRFGVSEIGTAQNRADNEGTGWAGAIREENPRQEPGASRSWVSDCAERVRSWFRN